MAGIDKKPKSVLRNEIDNHFSGNVIRSTEAMKQALDRGDFLITVRRKRNM